LDFKLFLTLPFKLPLKPTYGKRGGRGVIHPNNQTTTSEGKKQTIATQGKERVTIKEG